MKLDIAIIITYIAAINIIGLKYSRSKSLNDYFLGGRSLHWLVACFSIVATETSTLTFLSIPGLAYVTDLGFLQIAIGYIAGRLLVAYILLPRYFQGEISTTYEILQKRFGYSSRRIIAVIFHLTRLLADSVRLFITAIALAMLLVKVFDVENESLMIIAAILTIGIATFIYTFYGGISSVAIVDSIQLFLYLICAFLGIYLISGLMGIPIIQMFDKIPETSLNVFSTGMEEGSAGILNSYNIFSGIIGGLFLSFASHGTDHLIVQRVISCRDLKSGRRAMILSGLFVFIQFALFMILGLFIMVLLEARAFESPDKIMPCFIIEYLSPGFRGLMLSGIFAAAMSTLSSSINSLSSSTTIDIIRLSERDIPEERKVFFSRLISLGWTLVIVGISIGLMLFRDKQNPLVELGLAIASVTYGGMLYIFLIGVFSKRFNEKAAIAGVMMSICFLIIIIILNKVKVTDIFWPWFVVIGTGVAFAAGMIVNYFINLRNSR